MMATGGRRKAKSESRPPNRFEWLKACCRHLDINGHANRMTLAARLFGYLDDEGFCWPSRQTLAQEMSILETTVSRLIANLCDIGAIQKVKPSELPAEAAERAGRLSARRNAYIACFPWAEDINALYELEPDSWRQRAREALLRNGKQVVLTPPNAQQKSADIEPKQVAPDAPVESGFSKIKVYPMTPDVAANLARQVRAMTTLIGARSVHSNLLVNLLPPASRASALAEEADSGNEYAIQKAGL
jgi:hypothetical protein